ncbi:protein sel-1 homolog 3 [Oncorhynchus clarkii lewisi]|uniref:protein sel-1 homolog 3 n=1 Tax=Oncorhynchus clarkii lewisi TaxID=490388 RepID=UPI0039B82233
MKVFESFNLCGHAVTVVIVLSLALCESSSHITPTSSSPAGESSVLHGDSIQFDLVPDIVMHGSVVQVSYQCSRACEVGVEVMVPTQTKTGVAVFRRRWTNHRRLHVPRTHPVKLWFPPGMAYRKDLFMRRTLDIHNVMVRAWLDHLEQGKGDKGHVNRTSTYNGSLVRTFKVLQAVLPSERPARLYPGCPSWMADLMWQLTRDRIRQCPHESDTVDILTFPMVSTGKSFGVIRKIHPFINRDLERDRVLTVEQPSITVSIWVFLVQWCDKKLCGIIHHVDQNSKYDTPLMQLTNTGDIIIQVRVVSGGDKAFRAHTALPLWTWIRLDCFIQGSKVTLQVKPEMTSGGMVGNTHIFDFQSDIHYNDTGGYFVIGGGRFMPGFHGYFGPIKYYRLGTEKVINFLSPAKTLEGLEKTHRECDVIREVTAAFLQAVTHNQEVFMTGLCHSHYISLWRRFGQNTCRQTWTWEAQKKHRVLFTFLETQLKDFTTGTKNRKTPLYLGSRLFEHVVNRLSNRGSNQMDSTTTTSSLIALLQMSSCYGYHQSSLLLSTIHLAGLGAPVDQQQGHVYSLIGALGDNRLALMHLGYKHTQGIDGFPKDFDMAYSYYSNVGAQTSIDQGRVLGNQQYITEHILISNEDHLNSLTHETGDTFQYIKLQADRGDVESQKLLAKLLFWGQNGVSKDVGSAVKWYAKSAMELEDPAAMYEYSILLFKGQGVKRNMTLGLQILKKAAAKGSVQALNGLGWYYSTILRDYKTAYKYFEQAAHNGSHDGMFNLGVYHLNGKNPHNPEKNETAAFHLFLNSSLYGHVDGAVEAAWYLSTGNLEGVSRDTERAVIMLKQICEQNGYLGYIVREALQAYLQGFWGEALVRYALAAETGLGVAQNNVAYLCEELKQSYDCQWRYYNHSTMNYAPHDSGLLKMGDYYYSSSRLGAVDQAISLYSRAALAGSSQGIYTLVVLAEEGHDVPLIIRDRLNISIHDGLDIVVERLLQRCVELDEDEDLTPCTLALLRVRMGQSWRKMTQDPIQLSLVYISVVTLIIALITVLIQSALECLQVHIPARQRRQTTDRAVDDRTGTSPVNQAEVNGNGQQDQNDPIRREDRMSRTVRMAQGLWSILLRDGQRVQQTVDLAVTVSGVCLCVLCTLILHHLL